MRYIKQHWQKTIDADNAEDYDERCMHWMNEMKMYRPTISRDTTRPFLAYISCEIEEQVPEDAKERLQQKGVHLTCEKCENFRTCKTKSGKEDTRCNHGECIKDGTIIRVSKTADACLDAYERFEENADKVTGEYER